MKFKIMILVLIGFLIGEMLFAQNNPKRTDLYNLTKTLGKYQSSLERYQLRLITDKRTIYGPDLVGVTRPEPLKMVLSFNSYVSDEDLKVGRIEIYGEDNVFLHGIDYDKPLEIKRRQSINFFFTVALNIKLEHTVK